MLCVTARFCTKTKLSIDIFDRMRYTYPEHWLLLQLWVCQADERSVLHMKKVYNAPSLEFLAYASLSPIAGVNDWQGEEEVNNSKPWNDGELGGWT